MNVHYTRFEKARVIGARSLQLAMGAPALIKTTNFNRAIEVAMAEYEKNLVPITVIK